MYVPRCIFESAELRSSSESGWLGVYLNFDKWHDWACNAHEIAVYLIGHPCSWRVPDEVRLKAARQMLDASIRKSKQAILYSEQNGIKHLHWTPWADVPTLERVNRLPTWLLFRNLLDGQARLGLLDDFEHTAAQFIRAVEMRCVSPTRDAAAMTPETQLLLQSESLQLLAQKRALLHQVRSEWVECAEQRSASLNNMADPAGQSGLSDEQRQPTWQQSMRRLGVFGKGAPTSWELGLGLRIQIANEFAALSYARLQQQPTPSTSVAVLEAQHAVALLHANDDGSTLLQVRAALISAARDESPHAPVCIGDISYAELLLPSVLDQARAREAAVLGVAAHGFFELILGMIGFIECTILPQIRARARLTAVAAAYQQLGLALRAAGNPGEAQRAFDFADKIAAMRPPMLDSVVEVHSATGNRSFVWHWFGFVVLVLLPLASIMWLRLAHARRCMAPVLHTDLEDYKRGGGCRSLCAQPLLPTAANRARLTARELHFTVAKIENVPLSTIRASALLGLFDSDKTNVASVEQLFQGGAATGPGGQPKEDRVKMSFKCQIYRKMANGPLHNLAVLLLDNPCHWQMADEKRLQVARQLLEISAERCAYTIHHSDKHRGAQIDLRPKNWHDTRLERVLPAWDLWVKLLDAQARLGLRDEFERTATQLSRDVDARCDETALESQAAPDGQLASWARAFARRLISQQRAQLHAIRGEWDECAQQHVASVMAIEDQPVNMAPWGQHAARGSRNTTVPRTADLGIQMELAGQMAALSHARLQQSLASPTSPTMAAVLDAQHAVALLTAEAAPHSMSEIATALKAETAGVATEHIGAVDYSELLSEQVLTRVRQQQQQQGPPRGLLLLRNFLLPGELLGAYELTSVLQARAHTRLSLVAAVYQQLGLALRAAGQGAEAQQAFNFADELATMRPDMRFHLRAGRMTR